VKYITNAPVNGFTVEQVTQGQPYPSADVAQYLATAGSDAEPDISDNEALKKIAEAVDTTDVLRLGEGDKFVYAFGYRCAPDRLKIGLTKNDPLEHVFAQINSSTRDKPVLLLEIETHDCNSIERALHAILAVSRRKSRSPYIGDPTRTSPFSNNWSNKPIRWSR